MRDTDALSSLGSDEEEDSPPKYLTFPVGAETYGLHISYVREIIKIQAITPLPDVPEYVRGVINLRGRVIPVVDVRLRFRLPPRPYDERTCIVVVTVGEWSVGLVVDTVSEVSAIPNEDVEPAPSFVTHEGEHYLSGIGKTGGQVRLLLDVARFLDRTTTRSLAA